MELQEQFAAFVEQTDKSKYTRMALTMDCAYEGDETFSLVELSLIHI